MGETIYKPFTYSFIATMKIDIRKYIINKDATIIFWNDGTKTISKRHKDDEFDKELGFLFAYYYKKCGLSNASRKRVIESIDYKHIKTFLFEMFVKYSDYTPEKARKYLKELKSDYKPSTIVARNTTIKQTESKIDNNWLAEEFKKLDKRLEKLEIK